jgi:hypothetical protein
MAFHPCDMHNAPYRGPSSAVYPALVEGTENNRRHLRLCEPCFDDYLATVGARFMEVLFDGRAVIDLGESDCRYCSTRAEAGKAAFITAYPKHADSRQFWGRVCRDCTPAAEAELLLG